MLCAAPIARAHDPAVGAINKLGLDLLAESRERNESALISPWSIQSALAMAYAGASGATREEMRRVLHYPADETALVRALAELRDDLERIARESERFSEAEGRFMGPRDPLALAVANRLFGQGDYPFRQSFLDFVADAHRAPLELCDFRADHERERARINKWVEAQTRERIRDLIPGGGLNEDTRLVLVNAIYLKAPWMEPFFDADTKPRPFWARGVEERMVPTMFRAGEFRVRQGAGYTAVGVPLDRGDVHFLAIVPDDPAGLAAVEAALSADELAALAASPLREARLYLPKFRLEPPVMPLRRALTALGMRTAFDDPRGSADFDGIAPRRPNDYLYIDEVFHKTFLDLDEKGIEAAAATAVVMMKATSMPVPKPEPIEIRVDRPFLFAIQHRGGACLFLGRVTDPR
jgi:serpin B